MSAPDAFNATTLRSALVGTRFSAHVQHFPSVTSTNTLLLNAATNGAPEGTVYLADEQTAGRGRGGHIWHSAAGEAEPAGLYVSVLARPLLPLRKALWLSLVTGLAVQRVIQSISGVAIDLRWPNDLLIGTKKVGGILVETAVEPDATMRYAVIGIGVNLNQLSFPPELASLATSLRHETGNMQSRQDILVALLRALDMELSMLDDVHLSGEGMLQRFTSASTWVRGKRVTVPEQGGYAGVTAGLDGQGYLLVDADDGTQRTVLTGGVREAL